MAERKSKAGGSEEPKQDLTPMIDIVFNLIIFFMIVSELSNLDVEQINLPFADNAEEPPKGGSTANIDKVIQINILDRGLIKVKGKAMTADPKEEATAESQGKMWLAKFLAAEAAAYEREDPEQPGQKPPSKLRVNIRSDKDAPFKHVQQVFDACIDNGIYKTSLAATPDDVNE